MSNQFPNMIEQRLGALLDNKQKIFKSMLYSSVGGKYKRGVIFLYLSEVLGAKISSVLDIACAIEILHGYSLIHDDLPALDNAELRRGKASCHKAFGEATAILAGDGLLTYAFEVIANAEILPSATRLELIRVLSNAAGPKGMVEGQKLDIDSQNNIIDLEQLQIIHKLKTGKLFEFCFKAPAIILNFSPVMIDKLSYLGEVYGLIYQINDDIVDYEQDEIETGKDKNKDQILNKQNYVSFYGLERTKILLAESKNEFFSLIKEISSESVEKISEIFF